MYVVLFSENFAEHFRLVVTGNQTYSQMSIDQIGLIVMKESDKDPYI